MNVGKLSRKYRIVYYSSEGAAAYLTANLSESARHSLLDVQEFSFYLRVMVFSTVFYSEDCHFVPENTIQLFTQDEAYSINTQFIKKASKQNDRVVLEVENNGVWLSLYQYAKTNDEVEYLSRL